MKKVQTVVKVATLGAFLSLLISAPGCMPSWHAKKADKIAYSTISGAKKLAMPDLDKAKAKDSKDFRINYAPILPEFKDGQDNIVGLRDCIRIALANNLSYQRSKESLYIQALDYANAEHHWGSFGGSLSSGAAIVGSDNPRGADVARAAAAAGEYTFTQKLAHGGMITLGVGLDMATDLLAMDSTTFGSSLSATFTQPLLKGAWQGFAYEDIFRQRRDLIISVYEFERETQAFCTEIVSDYYSVLQELDRLNNELENIKRLQLALRRIGLQVEGGQKERTDYDRAQQSLLNARKNLLRLQNSYKTKLADLETTLNLPGAVHIRLDESELHTLSNNEAAEVPLVNTENIDQKTDQAMEKVIAEFDKKIPSSNSKIYKQLRKDTLDSRRVEIYDGFYFEAVSAAAGKAAEIALHAQPLILRRAAELRDAEKDIAKAANDFLPQLDLELTASAAGTAPRKPQKVRFHDNIRSAEVVFDYSIDQTDNRDAYRKAQIYFARAKRQMETTAGNLVQDIQEKYRTLVEKRRTYDLQVYNLAIAERRQKLSALLQAEGRTDTEEVLSAEAALRDAQNDLTSAAIDYENYRLGFIAEIGMLDVDTTGRFTMRTQPQLFKPIEKIYGTIESSLKLSTKDKQYQYFRPTNYDN